MGRPTKLTPKVREAFCNALSIGATREMAARYARISVASFDGWTRLGREERERQAAGAEPDPDKRRFLAFLCAVEDAEADAGITWLQVVDKAAQREPDWAWRMLKVRFPSGFQEITRTELSGPDGGAMQLAIVEQIVGSDTVTSSDTDAPSTS